MMYHRFVSSGYELIRSFLDSNELATVTKMVEHALAGPAHSGCSRPGNDLYSLRWNDAIIAYLLQSTCRLSRLRGILHADDLKWISAYLSIKPPHSPPLWWHQDWWCWDHSISFARAPSQVAVLCFLTATTKKNGALRVMPGTHHCGTVLHRALPEPHAETANALPAGHVALADTAEQDTIELLAGDAVALDYRLLHGTHANETARRRDCIILSFAPNWNALPREIKAHLIMHPALPDRRESEVREATCYDDILPRFDGTPESQRINRIPPANFAISDS